MTMLAILIILNSRRGFSLDSDEYDAGNTDDEIDKADDDADNTDDDANNTDNIKFRRGFSLDSDEYEGGELRDNFRTWPAIETQNFNQAGTHKLDQGEPQKFTQAGRPKFSQVGAKKFNLAKSALTLDSIPYLDQINIFNLQGLGSPEWLYPPITIVTYYAKKALMRAFCYLL